MSTEELEKLRRKLAQLEELQSIFRYWFRLREKTWPSECSGKAAGGYDLDLLDSDITGSVSAFVCDGILSQLQLDSLRYCDEALTSVVRELEGFPYWWFSQLKKLTSSILAYDERWGIPVRTIST
ncbi:MAG: hypothetical protein IPL32_08375 [Chloracidobacterium sp.]|nr:hypothetical protein [Chloracidobacterium sp.]